MAAQAVALAAQSNCSLMTPCRIIGKESKAGMTIEERFERIEHVTAGLAEERRKDREEFRQLWRDTQRHIDEVAMNLSKLTVQVAEMDDRLVARIEAVAEESRAADQRLGERIQSMVSAIGEFIRVQGERR
jgi:ABC-type transporter Mla subunit MlaD